MNFFVLTHAGSVIARPDSTRNKEKGDCFIPEDINTLGFTPVVYAGMCRTGKMIGEGFCERYYDSVGFGILLYPSCSQGLGRDFRRDESAVFDMSSILPLEKYGTAVLKSGDNVFSITAGEEEIFSCRTEGMKEVLSKAVSLCSAHSTIHLGDFVIAELDDIKVLCTRSEGRCKLKASFNDDKITDIDLKF